MPARPAGLNVFSTAPALVWMPEPNGPSRSSGTPLARNGPKLWPATSGTVTGTGYDQWNNTYIQIENDVYTVLYMHGVYGLAVGDAVTAGQVIGTESNIGYTLDSYGNVCGYTGRDCGYHTHLNVFDKRLGLNIDPLTLIPASYP